MPRATILKNLTTAKTVLFCDSEHFNKEITGCKNLTEIKDWFSIKGRLVKCGEHGCHMEYRLSGSDYKFSLTFVF